MRITPMKKRVKVFFDFEFTGLRKRTTAISLGMVSERGDQFYAEYTNYDRKQVDEWIEKNVIAHLYRLDEVAPPGVTYVKGDELVVAGAVYKWLRKLGDVEMWGDTLAYDWVLFCDLFGNATNLPSNVYYIPFDLATALAVAGIDPDVTREFYAEMPAGSKHNALWDAHIIHRCYLRLQGRL